MKTFEEIYEELQSADNNELNIAWQEAKKENQKGTKIALIICLILDIFIVAMFLKSGMISAIQFFLLFIIMFIFITNLMIFVIVKGVLRKKYITFTIKYKNIVINKIMSNFYNNLEYYPNKQMPEYIYKEASYGESYNRYSSEDYLEAQVSNDNSIQMAEVKTQKVETYRDSEGRTHTRTTTKFHGLFAKIVMNKSIKSELKIMQNGKMILQNTLKMDSSEFEKYFDVKASDKIIGMQLLTADVMEELIEFENKTKMKFDIFINNNELYLRFHSGEMFETGDLKKEALDKETIRKYFYMLNFTYNLSNRLITVVNDTLI